MLLNFIEFIGRYDVVVLFFLKGYMVMAITSRKIRDVSRSSVERNTVPKSNYSFGDSATLEEKQKILEDMGKLELIEAFKDWKPRRVKRRYAAPLDQRVSITITAKEKMIIEKEINEIKKSNEPISVSQFIRNKATSSVDIHGWRELAEKELVDLLDIESHQSELRKSRRILMHEYEDTEDVETKLSVDEKMLSIDKKLGKLVGHTEKRGSRLTGRMSMAEAETVRWRADRLCVSVSDYLRMMIFDMSPVSDGDRHMSLDARKRFYVSILDVAHNGFGSPPNIVECSQCGNYLEEIERLNAEIRQLRRSLY